jgi:hypothetical protein
MTKFYAASNNYSSESSIGFANTWFVMVFESKKSRDAYVASARNLAPRAIHKSDIAQYISRAPKPFTSQFYGIRHESMMDSGKESPEGFIGYVEVCEEENSYTTRLF